MWWGSGRREKDEDRKSGGRRGEMRHRGVETREREREGKGREEKEALPWQESEEKGEERGSGAPAAALSFPCPATAQAPQVGMETMHMLGWGPATGCFLKL